MQSLSDFYTSQNMNADGTPATTGDTSSIDNSGNPYGLYNGMNMTGTDAGFPGSGNIIPLVPALPIDNGSTTGDPNNPDITMNVSGSSSDLGSAPVDNGVGNTVANGPGGSSTIPSTTTSPSVMSTLFNTLGLSPSTLGTVGGIAAAINDYNNAGQYTNIANQASTMANPFGPYRDEAAQRLMALEQNPAEIANTPGYQFSMNQILDQTGNKMRAEGLTGSTQQQQGLANAASGLAQTTYNNTITQLANQAGTQFSPDAAASLLASGLQDSMAARGLALQDLFAPNSAQGNPSGSTLQPGGSTQPGGGFTMPNLGGLGSGGGTQSPAPIVNAGTQAPTSGEFAPTGTGDSGTPNYTPVDTSGNDLGVTNDDFGPPGGE